MEKDEVDLKMGEKTHKCVECKDKNYNIFCF